MQKNPIAFILATSCLLLATVGANAAVLKCKGTTLEGNDKRNLLAVLKSSIGPFELKNEQTSYCRNTPA